jgi:hypothetical protein
MGALRVGVLLAGPRLAAWAAWILRSIAERRDLTLTLAILVPAPRPARGRLFAIYEWLDRRLFAAEPDASKTVDCSALLEGVPREAADIDVLVRLGGARPEGIEARHGVRSLRWGRVGDTAPPLLWELSARAPVVEVVLERDGAEVISRSTSRTDVPCAPAATSRSKTSSTWSSADAGLMTTTNCSSCAPLVSITTRPPSARAARRRRPR